MSTEWAIGPYNNPQQNPFNQVVRCQDCHMSLYPYGGNSTYLVDDPATGEKVSITSPTPAVFPINFAAEPVISTAPGIPLPRRKVVTHYFTGIDVPLLYDSELNTFLGPNFPSVQLNVTAKRRGGAGDVTLYRSGYLVDKPHPETGELSPDGNYHDEDQEHVEAVVNPFTHDNEVFQLGPDDGPHARIFEGRREGLVFFRNELVRFYGPGTTADGRNTRIPGANRNHPRTGMPLINVMEEETFSAGQTNFVDNWRALPPLYPRSYTYEIHLPSAEELEHLGYPVEGPIRVTARVHFQHFPPLFLRFLARVAGAYVEQNVYQTPRMAPFVGLRGPANRDLNLYSEQRIDDLLRIMTDIATAEVSVPLSQ